MSTGLALLGVLAVGPAHGYDLKRAYDNRFPSAKPLPYGQVYATLSRLVRDDRVEVVETGSHGGPERTVYALTDQGTADLRAWLNQTEPAGPYAADDLVRKVVTALHLGADTHGFLRRQRTAHLAAMRELTTRQRATTDPAARIALDHSIFHLDADLRWLETASARTAAEGNAP